MTREKKADFTRFFSFSSFTEGCFTGNKNESQVRKCKPLSLPAELRLFAFFCTITMTSTSKEMSNAKEIKIF